jgi:hypothetical protein
MAGRNESATAQYGGSIITSVATVERLGDAYRATYRDGGGVQFVGVGLRDGDRLSVRWAARDQAGIGVHRIERGPKLVGQFTPLGGGGVIGQETLTVAKKD